MICLRFISRSIYSSRSHTVGAICVNRSSGHSLQQLSIFALLKTATSNRRGICTSKHTSPEMLNSLPFFACGEIVKGFGRGSRELGIPTANYPLEVVKSVPPSFQSGVYFGWANVDNGEVYKMVMSVGWNPFYDNKEKSVETHILHEFNRDLYGHILKICVVGFLRPQENYDSVDTLIAAIKDDIVQASKILDSDEDSLKLKESKFFKDFSVPSDKVKENLTNGSDKVPN